MSIMLVLAVTAFLMIRGAGAASVDRLLSTPSKSAAQVQVAR